LKVFVTLGDGVVFGELSILNVPGSKVYSIFNLKPQRRKERERKKAPAFDTLVLPVRINLTWMGGTSCTVYLSRRGVGRE
jgi:hypothetical protein